MNSIKNRPSSGRTRLTVLLATVGALLLVPAAQALAATGTVNIEGTGNGEVFGFETAPGSPPLACTYKTPGPATGVCETEMQNEGIYIVGATAKPAPGSEFVGWVVEENTAEFTEICELNGGKGFPSEAGPTCFLGTESESGTAKVTAFFECETEGGCEEGGAEEFPLTVTKSGTGSGTVTSTPAGINCGSECEAEFEEGEEVELTQAPTAGSEFVEWTGACTGSGACEVTMSEAKSVGAKFDLEPTPESTLSVTIAGTGTGTVQCKFNAGSAGACTSPQPNGTSVEIIATANAGSTFAGFSGGTGSASACTTSPCSFTITANSSVAATFNLIPRTLSVTKAGTGTGTVQCKFNAGSAGACTSPQPNGTTVEIIATASSGSEFAGFSGGTGSASGCSTSPCSFTITANSAVTATFSLEPPEFDLTIVKAGTGSGSVTCDGGACASTYEEGEEITLAASAASGSTFSGWSGGGCSGTASCNVTITADTTVTATFTASPAPPTPTCATDPSLCPPPPPPAEGTAKAAASAQVKSGKAELKLSCTGGPCKGTVQLTAKVKQGKKTKSLVIGKASFSISEGATATVKVKLSGPAKQELAKGKTLKAKASGTGITASTVKVKPAKKA